VSAFSPCIGEEYVSSASYISSSFKNPYLMASLEQFSSSDELGDEEGISATRFHPMEPSTTCKSKAFFEKTAELMGVINVAALSRGRYTRLIDRPEISLDDMDTGEDVTYYQILGVSSTASTTEILRAYTALVGLFSTTCPVIQDVCGGSLSPSGSAWRLTPLTTHPWVTIIIITRRLPIRLPTPLPIRLPIGLPCSFIRSSNLVE
jgi:hypothetical protein